MLERSRAVLLSVSLIALGCAGSEELNLDIAGHAGAGGNGGAGNGSATGTGGTTGSAGASGSGGTTGAAGAGLAGTGAGSGTTGGGGRAAGGSAGTSALAGRGGTGGATAAGGRGGSAAGGGGTGGGAGGAGGVNTSATFTKIYNTIIPQCAGSGCHLAPPYAGGFNFSTKASAFKSWNDNVFPGFGDDSPMFQVLNFGIMPKDRPSLSVEELFLVRDWINAGALNN